MAVGHLLIDTLTGGADQMRSFGGNVVRNSDRKSSAQLVGELDQNRSQPLCCPRKISWLSKIKHPPPPPPEDLPLEDPGAMLEAETAVPIELLSSPVKTPVVK